MLNYLKSEDGAGAAEYALILAVFGGVFAISVINLRSATRTAVANAAAKVATADTSAGTGGSGGAGGSTDTNTTCTKKNGKC